MSDATPRQTGVVCLICQHPVESDEQVVTTACFHLGGHLRCFVGWVVKDRVRAGGFRCPQCMMAMGELAGLERDLMGNGVVVVRAAAAAGVAEADVEAADLAGGAAGLAPVDGGGMDAAGVAVEAAAAEP